MHQTKTCTLELANLGKPMDPEDIIAKVIRGLNNPHYRAIKEMVEARDTPISFDALHEKLINHDLSHPESTSLTTVPTTAFATTYRGPNNCHSARPNTPSSLPRYNATETSALAREPTVCQYCSYKGHTFTNRRNFKKAHPHFVLTPYSRPPRYPNHRAQTHTATAHAPPSPTWLVDSGATHHLTNDLSNLASHVPYDGLDDVLIGDGSALPISNIGYLDGSGHSPRNT
ncbi:hypothetical protein vseg_015436 [Gypsophila vaccaria]